MGLATPVLSSFQGGDDMKVTLVLLLTLFFLPLTPDTFAASKRRHKRVRPAAKAARVVVPEDSSVPCDMEHRVIDGKETIVIKLLTTIFAQEIERGRFGLPVPTGSTYPEYIADLAKYVPLTEEIIINDDYLAFRGNYKPDQWQHIAGLLQQIFQFSVGQADVPNGAPKPLKIMHMPDCTTDKSCLPLVLPPSAQVAKGVGNQ
jgi:hypothetical protein